MIKNNLVLLIIQLSQNKLVIGKTRDENSGVAVKIFVGLKPKI